jgi:hypothetical protein
MFYADQVLDDQQLLSMVYEALTRRRPTSRTRGRLGTPAEVVQLLLLLKHRSPPVSRWAFARSSSRREHLPRKML